MEKRFSGRVWLMRKDIDTDIIAPTQILGLPMEEMIKHIFEPLYPDLAAQIQQGDKVAARESLQRAIDLGDENARTIMQTYLK